MSEFGDAVFTTVYSEGIEVGFRVDKADPLIQISGDLIDEWRKAPVVTEGSSVSLHDDLVHIQALNGVVTYRLGEHLLFERAYVAERVSCTIEFPG